MSDNGSTELDPPLLYTSVEANILAFTPYLTAPLSVIGSSLIIWSIWFKRNELLQTVYHRIMLCMSLLDFFTALGMVVLGPWAVPEHYQYGRSGRGNEATCEVAGFFLNLTFGSLWYSLFLAIHFVMLIRWEWKERKIACCLEPFGHMLGFAYVVYYSVVGTTNHLFNPLRKLPGWCWFTDNPPFCSEKEHVECERGEDYNEFTDFVDLVIVAFIFAVIIVCMILLVLKVNRLERNMQQYTVGQVSYDRTRETGQQALLYIAAFLLSFSPLVVVNRLGGYIDDPNKYEGTIFFFALLTKILTPLTGFMNAIVYFRRRFAKLIKEGESLAFLCHIPYVGKCIVAHFQRGRRVGRQHTATATAPETRGSSMPHEAGTPANVGVSTANQSAICAGDETSSS